jgi:nucleoside-diphosphate-sugar epimerase
MSDDRSSYRVVVYGGNGYVGSRFLELASKSGAHCISVSRSGCAPVHLLKSKPPWLAEVNWIVGDAAEPDYELIKWADVVVCLVGSPPIPTLSKSAFDRQLRMNGACNSEPIRAAKAQGVSRIVLMSAHIPSLLCSDKFAYYLGKEQALDTAREYINSDPDNSVVVLRPSAIYGTRHTRSGWPVPLGLLMAPINWLMKFVPRSLTRLLPVSPVSVDRVAQAIVNAAVGPKQKGLRIIENQQLLGQGKHP